MSLWGEERKHNVKTAANSKLETFVILLFLYIQNLCVCVRVCVRMHMSVWVPVKVGRRCPLSLELGL